MISDLDFKYCVYFDYSVVNDCYTYGCNDDGVCRCSKITDESVKSINYESLIKKIYESYFNDEKSTKRNNILNSILYGIVEIDSYTIDRILRTNKIWENKNWNINICDGYYGEEIFSITLKEDISRKISKEIEDCIYLTSVSSKIEYLLNLEYNRILPELIDCKYELVNINKEDIEFGSKSHYNIVKNDNTDHYSDSNYHGIRGIVISDGDKYRIIDGYHRCYATNKKVLKVLKAYK